MIINAKLLFIYLLVINAVAYFVFYLDKQAAKADKGRISEKSLLMLAFIGGTFGAVYAQQTLRHKTHKQPFRFFLYAIAVLQFLLVVLGGVLVLKP